MANPHALHSLLEMMQNHTDQAAQRLGRLLSAERDAKARLDLLCEYRGEYVTKLQRVASSGIGHMEWRNYQLFLSRLDQAIAQQEVATHKSCTDSDHGRADWQTAKQKERAIDLLLARQREREAQHRRRQEQKEADEFAARPKDDNA